MANDILVILGAGASFDVVNKSDRHPATILDADLRPPLTNKLFGDEGVCAKALEDYPDVLSLAATIRNRLRDRGASLESVLADINDAPQEHRRSQVYQVPLYLADVFWQVSTGYTSLAVNYTTLVDELFESFDLGIFLTLNYDLLLDRVLSGPLYWGGEIRDMTSYIRERWALVKLHGSVNWGRRLDLSEESKPPPFPSNPTKQNLVRVFSDWPPKGRLSDEISVRSSYKLFWSDGPHYPALALPVAGKYEYVCPRLHIDALEDRLPVCDTVLVIGASGKDRDLLDILKANLGDVKQFVLVGDGEDAAKASTNFLAVPQLGARGAEVHNHGFSNFIQRGGLDALRQVARQDKT